jgi:hypothetical protein
MKPSVIDAKEKFTSEEEIHYQVQVSVRIDIYFLLAVLKCIFMNKDMRITQNMNNKDFLIRRGE